MDLGAVRYEAGREMTIAGLNATYNKETRGKIPAHWERFAPQIGKVPGQVGDVAFGVAWNFVPDCGFDYLTGVEVGDSAKLPADFEQLKLAARRYAVFTHDEHVSKLPQTIDKIWMAWVPESGLKTAQAPCFERYTEEFCPDTGRGGMEIWIPLES